MWWRPGDSGYTLFLEAAGQYTKEQVEAKPHYYNDGKSTRAVPVEAVRAVAKLAVYSDYIGDVMASALPLLNSGN